MKSFLQFIIEASMARNMGLIGGAALTGALALNQTQPVQDNTTQQPAQPGTVLQTQTEVPEDQKPKEEKPDPYAHFGGEHNVKLYKAIMGAEFRGRDMGDPLAFNADTMVRTSAIPPLIKNKKTGKMQQLTSSAYGPLQITVGTVSGFRKQHPDLFEGIDEDYLNTFEEQGKKMIKAGNVKGGPYGLGGCGELCDEKHIQNYQKTGIAVMRGKMRELKIDDTKPLTPEDQERFARYWAGQNFGKDYMKAFSATYN